MTETTEALPSIFAIFLIPIPVLIFYGLTKFFYRAYAKADYEPEHWKDLP